MLICIGEILVDIFDDGKNKTVLPGGAPFNVACNALLYTKDVAFIGAVGNDEYGRLLQETANNKPFKYCQIDVLPNRYTSKAIVSLNNGERSFRFERASGADYAININDINFANLRDDDIVHIGSLMLSEEIGRKFFDDAISQIRDHSKAKISFDINYRDDIFSSKEEAKKVFLSAIKKADILKFSLEELEMFSPRKDISTALNELLNDQQIAVVTLGKEGSIFYHHGNLLKVDSYPMKPIDTTGAGDAFYAYFLSCLVNKPDFINKEEKIKYYLKRANVVGGLTTLKKGAINSAPREEEIDTFLKNDNLVLL